MSNNFVQQNLYLSIYQWVKELLQLVMLKLKQILIQIIFISLSSRFMLDEKEKFIIIQIFKNHLLLN